MDAMGFKVADNDALGMFERRIRASGLASERIAANADEGCGERVRFIAPTGHTFELNAEMTRVGNGLSLENPEVWPDGFKGMHPSRFDHCLLYGDDVDGSIRLFTEVLGLNIAERVVTPDRSMVVGAFLTCNTKPHDSRSSARRARGSSTTRRSTSNPGTISRSPPISSPSAASSSTSARRGTGSRAAARSISSIRPAIATRPSPADTSTSPTGR